MLSFDLAGGEAAAAAFVTGLECFTLAESLGGVESLVAHTSVSRRSLETRFRLSVGTSPYDYINAVRIERAKKLLTMGEKQKLSAVAGACGFHDARRMNVVFERLAGVKPSAFRANFLRKQTN